MPKFFVHNGYLGWSYGTPADPQLVSDADAVTLMARAGLTMTQVGQDLPPAQYAEDGDRLFRLTGGNRFLRYGRASECADINPDKVHEPLVIHWDAP